ncbi:MAG: Predicted cobalt transporter CbtA [uncultured Propionibacteriaceae bacterium]|uniref:Predicted cobalt transporter CbtA n=1 Tax=uncultured Propionibacteriaceae bacterium TaxID=257457 RepID=A0A6J4PI08_9ACTN|nr:MAG: Predicted cobalt transporter CbtA [uncultured Propionibacteriaceae bacterium]
MSARHFLTRGLLAGLLAGIVAFGVAYLVGEPSLNAAIAVEQTSPGVGTDHSHDSAATEQSGGQVSRTLQSTLGLLTGTVVAGVTLGGLVGVLSALALGRFGSLGPRATTLGVAATCFVAGYVTPFLTYPPNPPAVGSSDSIPLRTALYFTLIVISVIAVLLAVVVGRHLQPRIGGWYASLVAVGAYLVVSVTAAALLPSFDEVPTSFPAGILYDFRIASFLTQLALWSVLGITLAELVHRLAQPTPHRKTQHVSS